MSTKLNALSRRRLLRFGGAALGAFAATPARNSWASVFQDLPQSLPSFTGPGPNSYWNSVGPYVSYSQKSPLILLTDRPVQLETPRHDFLSPFTSNDTFYVRWHLDELPTAPLIFPSGASASKET
jgi:hypothetical protein